ncbi:SusC/RagA family TonB-linked outer membrane protein [Seonamhaeicola aphaedonensis]|uniref:TonB-linked SusC/RagA family outer membrane protein n=1 Tax=Seonamhaeicola aphaedonensis TaxID=1461338 RepID=A0A3D9HKU3_9FLAO|nr:SusC/RagA family TonB-linked outer membrane protein [Seonamhaeicola aphaedonensis]RED50035.1 TonB-linked SusC/RagA family outer membrane protein [Seonamhaeicola aphaedonensis]
MKTKFSGILTLILAFVVHISFAQEKTISGTVSDNSGLPLPGATVLVKGTTTGTSTDFDGNYTISVNQGSVLVFSFVGYTTQEMTVGASSTINVTMVEDATSLEEVVVTAQGIKREKKALGYAVTTIDADAIENKPETDVAKLLTGKVAGVQVNTAGGFLGQSPSVIIRSKNSITGNNQPLYIIDGIPITGDRTFDLDPNNIASTSVLKGLAASTLYGEDGRNGVILITTKTGSTTQRDKKFEIQFLQTTSLLEVANLPEYQNKYGQGADNAINTTFFGTWGAAFDGQIVPHHLSIGAFAESFPEFQGATVEYKAIPNNVSDFFNAELGTTTSVLVSKKTEEASFAFNASYADQQGFVESSSLKRLNLSFGGEVKLSNKFSLSAKADIINTDTNRPSLATFQLLTWIPRNLDIQNLPYQDPNTGASVYYRTTITNPIWNVKNSGFNLDTDRFIGSANLKYQFSDKVNLTYTYGLDLYNELNFNYTNKGGNENPLGFIQSFDNYNKVQNHRVILGLNSIDLAGDFSMNGQLGFETKNTIRDVYGVQGLDQIVFGVLDLDNFREFTPITAWSTLDGFAITPSEQNRIGLFGAMDFAYKNYLYLNVQARNDWASTVEKPNQSVFYPSVALSFIPSSAFEGFGGNYLKFRASYGSSASFPIAYLTRPTLTSQGNGWINPFDGSTVAFNSLDSFLPNPDLGPEKLREYELGTEGRFLNNRLTFDISLYSKRIEDQILYSDLPNSTGFVLTQINAGDVETKGIEIGLNLVPIQTEDFIWSINNNFTAYESTVYNLPVDLIEIGTGAGINGNTLNTAINGEPFGVFRGNYAVKDDDGNLLINPTTGKIIFSEDVGLPNDIIGDPNEDFRFTTINSITYKNWSLSAQLEYVHGGDIYSNSAVNLLRRGVTRDTENREESYIIPGVLGDPATGEALTDGNGDPIPNNIQIGANDLYFINLMDVDENAVFDATTVRLRDISLSYNMPEKLLEKTPFGTMSFTLSGNNLWYYTPNLPKYLNLDPEVLLTGQGNTFGVDFQNAPSYKQYSLSIKLTF